MSATPTSAFTPADESQLRDSLRRCSPECVEAAVRYRRTGDVSAVSAVVMGVLARYLDPEQRPKLQGDCDGLRLTDDLGVDSLTMVEVVMLVEEALVIKIENEDLRDQRTLGDVKAYVDAKVRGLPRPEKTARPVADELHNG